MPSTRPSDRAGRAYPQGRIVPGVGWFEDDYLGIDQGPIVLMAENYRSGLIWNLMKKNPHIVRGPVSGRLHRRLARGALRERCPVDVLRPGLTTVRQPLSARRLADVRKAVLRRITKS